MNSKQSEIFSIDVRAYRSLTAAVLMQAVDDLWDNDARVRADAQRFLETDLWESVWFDGIDLEPESVLKVVREKVAQAPAMLARRAAKKVERKLGRMNG